MKNVIIFSVVLMGKTGCKLYEGGDLDEGRELCMMLNVRDAPFWQLAAMSK
jgi:hypothetical protein